jgi:hypothetical protein
MNYIYNFLFLSLLKVEGINQFLFEMDLFSLDSVYAIFL